MGETPSTGWREIDRWRGGVDERLRGHDRDIAELRQDIEAEHRWHSEHERSAGTKEGQLYERINEVSQRVTRQEERMLTVAAVGAAGGGLIGTIIGLLAAWFLGFVKIGA